MTHFRRVVFPIFLKTAYVTPLLKKPSMDKNVMKNYRLVSHLSFISKLFEKDVIHDFNRGSPMSICQCTGVFTQLRQHCSRSKMTIYICGFNESDATTLLDHSTALDMVDHSLHLTRFV